MNRLITFVFLFIFQISYSQDFSARMWHSGWLVTMEGDTLRGDIKYDMPNNAVQIIVEKQKQKKVFTFSSKKLMYFQIFDNNLKNYRQFYSIPYRIRRDYRAPVLFEVLYEGRLTLLLRERIVIENDPYQSYMYAGTSSTTERLVFTYYFVDRTGKIILYEGQKGEIYEIFAKHAEAVRKYVKDNKLKLDDMRDLVRVTAFYNSL